DRATRGCPDPKSIDRRARAICRAGRRHQGRVLHIGPGGMMAAVSPGFSHPVFQAQSAFRAVLAALSRPGTVQALAEPVEPPEPLSPGAAAIALTLCDHDTPVWLDDALRTHSAVGEWLRFHCGCLLSERADEAAFAFVHSADTAPAFDAF